MNDLRTESERLPTNPAFLSRTTVLRSVTVRLVVLDWQQTNITIKITSTSVQAPHVDYVAATQPIVNSLQFVA